MNQSDVVHASMLFRHGKHGQHKFVRSNLDSALHHDFFTVHDVSIDFTETRYSSNTGRMRKSGVRIILGFSSGTIARGLSFSASDVWHHDAGKLARHRHCDKSIHHSNNSAVPLTSPLSSFAASHELQHTSSTLSRHQKEASSVNIQSIRKDCKYFCLN